MATSGAKRLGPVARRLISPDRWKTEYPAWEAYAKELDELLLFADSQGRLSQFVPRLEAKDTQRDEALEELRVAYLLHHSGFPIVQWEPQGLNTKVGEYLIGTPEQQGVFVEVKSRGWEGELSDQERLAGRTKEPKYRDGEGGAVGNWMPLQRCIASENTYPKFSPAQPNLLIVADDLKLSLHDTLNHVEVALYNTHPAYDTTGYFTSPQFENLGGVGIFRAFSAGRGLEYEFELFENPFALPSTKLPASILKFKAKQAGIVRATYVPRRYSGFGLYYSGV